MKHTYYILQSVSVIHAATNLDFFCFLQHTRSTTGSHFLLGHHPQGTNVGTCVGELTETKATVTLHS